MATNDFLPFAVGGSANVLSQSAYAALSAINNGYSSGVANSAQMNKTWRQSSIMAAVLSQFIVNQTGQNATDDGTTATLLTNLIAAVKASSTATIGTARSLAMSVSTASASATMTADEIVVGSALGGLKYTLASFSKTVNLATTGAGGMDTGTAPASGYVALYAIYNPTTGATALLATNATSTLAPNVYGGANMPSGYTASALVAVWPTNGSSQMIAGEWRDRSMWMTQVQVLNSTTAQTQTSLSIANAVPLNAKLYSGFCSLLCSANALMTLNLWSTGTAGGVLTHAMGMSVTPSAGSTQVFANAIVKSQSIGYSTTFSAGVVTFNIFITGYTI